jgi:hypothetical protein
MRVGEFHGLSSGLRGGFNGIGAAVIEQAVRMGL